MSRTMIATANYNSLDNASRNTLDTMSRDIRNSAGIAGYQADTNSIITSITLTNPIAFGRSSVTYAWDGNNVFSRTYIANGTATTKTMLTNCDSLQFLLYQRNPSTNGQFSFVDLGSITNETKLVSVSWRCSRKILGVKLNTESVQTAKITIRN